MKPVSHHGPCERQHVEIDGDLYLADRVGPDGRPLPITQEQAEAISRILAEEYESNPALREVVDARAQRLAEGQNLDLLPVAPRGERRRSTPPAGVAPSGEAA